MVFQHVQTDPMLLSCCSYMFLSYPGIPPFTAKKRCATQCFHCVTAPDPWHPWVDGSVDRTHHRHGWKAPLRFCWTDLVQSPWSGLLCLCMSLSAHLVPGFYGRIFCQETLWIFCSKKLIWSEPKGLLLCLGCFLETVHFDNF